MLEIGCTCAMRASASRYTCITLVLLLSALCCAEAFPKALVIKGGTVVNADRSFTADVLLENGLIAAVGLDLQAPEGARVIDASGKLVMPGGIDPHTHLEMPSFGTLACDDFYSGQAAALAGGTTMHIDFALPVNGSLSAGLTEWRRKAAIAVMDYGFHMAVTSWDAQVERDMEALAHVGINSFKFFMAYKGVFQVSDEHLLAGFAKCLELGALPQVHAEHGEAVARAQQQAFDSGITGPEGHAVSRPAVLEAEATARAIRLAKFIGVPLYVVHVMATEALEEVVKAKAAGQRVIGEAVASGVSCDASGLWDPDFDKAARFVMSPPIRGAGTAAKLRGALAGGPLSMVATDHAVFNSTQKRAGRHDFRKIPNGVNGIEERLHVVWQEMVVPGLITPSRFVDIVSTATAQAFGIYPRKGVIAPGSDADVIVFDPAVEHTISAASHHSRMDTNIYEGKRIRGKVVVTISQGKVVYEGGKLTVVAGAGRYVPRPLHPPIFEGMAQHNALRLSEEFPYGQTPVRRQGDAGPARDEL